VIACAALLLRLVYLFLFFHDQPIPSGNRYVIGYETGSIAASLAGGHGYGSPLYVPSGPTAWITPVYPLLLAGVFKIFGTYTFGASVAIRSINAIFSSLTCYPLFFLGKRLFGRSAGTTAAWLWAVLPAAVFFPIVWVWDTSLSALLLITCLLATYAIEDRDDVRAWSLFGAFWGFSILVNAAILSVLPGCFLFLMARARQRGARYLKLASVAAAFVLLTISPWVLRNLIVFHGQVALRSNFGLELWLGNNPEVPISASPWLHPNDAPKEKQEFLRLGEVAYMREKRSEAIHFIATHPADTLRFQYHRLMLTWTGFEDSLADVWPTAKPMLRAELALNYALPLLMLFGLLLAHRNFRPLSLPLLNVVVFFPAVYYICHTNARYRHPIDTVMVVLSAYSMVWLAGQFADGRALWRPFKRRPEAIREV
jgi:4-amino-4-deoxy-L-arabinose transferase-like glycosyltransferase